MRPTYGQLKNPITKISTATCSALPESPNADCCTTPDSAIANSSSGNARNTFISQLSALSTQPPANPATSPIVTPISTDNSVEPAAMSSENCDPTSTRESRSRPLPGSTPSGWAQLTPPNAPTGRP